MAEDPDIIYKEYLEFHLHEHPKELRSTVIDKVNALEGDVDSVFLAYGICQSLEGVINELRVPTATLKEDDCIGVLLTTDGYEEERKNCTGTFYATPYFAQYKGLRWFKEELCRRMPNYEELGIDFDWYMDRLFDGYSRCLLIDTGVGDQALCEHSSKEFADYLNLEHQSRTGTLERLEDGLLRAKSIAYSSPI
ncbi:MAG: DUF1638 domain-containing protein [Euryarchaeota archaeon]|nr:DUF1638 domain-containing protein [Euryarchaeota archaeon]